MKNEEEKNSKTAKLLSAVLATELIFPVGIDAKKGDFESIESQIRFHQKQHEFLLKIANLSEELYDKAYDDYCNSEEIEINGNKYPIKNLYIEYGYVDDEKKVYLKDFHKSNIDIITGKEIDKEYKRVKAILLKYSNIFYDYYYGDKLKPFEYYVNMFEGGINYEVPETYFYNPRFNSESIDKKK